MIILLIWFLLGLGGHFLILQSYKILEGYRNPIRMKQQLPAIFIGPIAILIGLLQLWDVYTDPPKL